MRQVWLDEDHCTLDGVKFQVARDAFNTRKTSADCVWVLKGKSFFERYDTYFSGLAPAAVLELGIFEGGSALLLADKWPAAKIVGIDIRVPNPSVVEHARRMGFADRISLHYETSQGDANAVRKIVTAEFPDGIDIVIDDASHFYALTKSSFNTLFPRLKPGGLYVVEDWAWAHWRQAQDKPEWKDRPALSNLLFEITMACATSSHLISDVYVNGKFFGVKKSSAGPRLDDHFDLDKHYALRGKTLNKI